MDFFILYICIQILFVKSIQWLISKVLFKRNTCIDLKYHCKQNDTICDNIGACKEQYFEDIQQFNNI